MTGPTEGYDDKDDADDLDKRKLINGRAASTKCAQDADVGLIRRQLLDAVNRQDVPAVQQTCRYNDERCSYFRDQKFKKL